EHRALGHRASPELGRICLSQNGSALIFKPANGVAIERRDRSLELKRPEAVAITGERRRFLDRDRNALEKTPRLAARDVFLGGGRLTFYQVSGQQDVGVELWVEARDPVVVKSNQLGRLDGPLSDRACLLQCRRECPGVIDHPLTVSTLLPLPRRKDRREVAVAQAVELARVRRHLDDVRLAAVVDEEQLTGVLRSVEVDAQRRRTRDRRPRQPTERTG